jgi:hypothetical protein
MIKPTGSITHRKLHLFMIMVVLGLLASACGSPSSAVQPTVDTAAATSATPATGDLPSKVEVSYTKDIAPILEASCVKCHGVEKVSRGLDLTTYDKAMAGSVKGPVITAGDAENSLLYKLLVQGKMPKQGAKLTQAQIETIKAWIAQGALNN